MLSPVVQMDHVTHRFGKQIVLDDISLDIPAGSVYGFLGPNGAGKTTTLRLVLGLLQKQNGSISLFGQELRTQRIAALRRTGSLVEQPSLYLHLTAKENLEIFRLSYQSDRKRIGEVLAITGLGDAGNKKVKAFSLGMKQRLAVAIALLHDPELLILDEPTNGLDPNGIIETRDLIKQLNIEQGKTILVSSHLLSEIEKMATDVAIIHKGKLLFQGALPGLQKARSGRSFIEIDVDDMDKAMRVLTGKFISRAVNGKINIGFESREQVALINTMLVQEGVKVSQLSVRHDDLENLFIQIISD
ncbi:MAG: ABC transporter ATP-binding protein [Bacteroidota bacterium]|nr:ABC transporter ATP-binding protein [Bacteroidota bacterium]